MDKSFTIGTNPLSDIRVASKYVSEEHAILFQQDQRVYIEDLESTFGTFVNGKKIDHRTELTAGDRVKLGTQLFHWMDLIEGPEKESNPIFIKDLFYHKG